MSDQTRVQELLEQALSSGASPEEVCAGDAQLLADVRARWEECRRLDARLAALFPSNTSPGPSDDADSPTAFDGNYDAERLPAIPRYEVEGVLGRGGMGIVYRARDQVLRRRVALKMLLSGAYASGVERARFLREARAVATLQHPHVVQVHEVGEHESRPYFTMELVEGGSLAQMLAGVPQPPERAAKLMESIAGAVEAAHRAGIIHRDLKPGNVLLTADGTPKVGDFGLALQSGDGGEELSLTRSGTRIGTPSYMAPEQAAGRSGAVGPPTDVYSLGAILYEMLTGRPPFRGETAAETERHVINEEPVPPGRLNPRVPRDLETICLKCLRKEPARRYASAAGLAEDLGRFSRGEPVAARRAGHVERALKWVRRRPAAAALWAGGTVVALALAGGALWLAAGRAADARAATTYLADAAKSLQASDVDAAKSALYRAELRLDGAGPAALRARLETARGNVDLVQRLDTIQKDTAYGFDAWNGDARADHRYTEAFKGAGIDPRDMAPDVAAERVLASDIRLALVGALCHWQLCAPDPGRKRWIVDVLKRAENVPPAWRARAFEPVVARDEMAAAAADPTLAEQPVHLLLLVVGRMRMGGVDPGPLLLRMRQAHPADFWANLALSQEMRRKGDPLEAVRYAQAAAVLRPDAGVAHHLLGVALRRADRREDALAAYREAARLDPHSAAALRGLGAGLVAAERYDEAVLVFQAVMRAHPDDEDIAARGYLGVSLDALGRPDEALQQYRHVIARGLVVRAPEDPKNFRNVWITFRAALARRGLWDELLATWRKQVDIFPYSDEAMWSGYAEFCLFRGQNDEYRRVCRLLLEQAERSADPRQWEVVGRTCLLMAAPPEELQRATNLIDRALASEPNQGGNYRNYRVAKGLAEYRAGRYEAALQIMEGDAAGLRGPLPQLVAAMCRARLGQTDESKRAMARAVLAFDWSARRAHSADEWTYHVLGREAEAIVVPELAAFLEGRYQPRDAHERLAMAGACQYRGLHAAHARLWADAFTADPALAVGGRYYAVGAATAAGCGLGNDAATLTEAERASWRARARDWMRQELTAAAAAVAASPQAVPLVRARLHDWTISPEMAAVREQAALSRLPAAERDEWATLWQRVDALYQRIRAQNPKPGPAGAAHGGTAR